MQNMQKYLSLVVLLEDSIWRVGDWTHVVKGLCNDSIVYFATFSANLQPRTTVIEMPAAKPRQMQLWT